MTAKGWTLLSYDYLKLAPCTAADILANLHSLYAHYHATLAPAHHLSATNIFVAGYSAGGYVAQLAAVHLEPKPLGIFLVAAQGGRMLAPHYYACKAGADADLPPDLARYIGPAPSAPPAAAVPQTDVAEFRARLALAAEVWRRGLKLDLLTGECGLSARLRALGDAAPAAACAAEVPERARALLPELLIDETFPPAYIVYGSADTTVRAEEALALVENLKARQVRAELVVVEGADHHMMGWESIYRGFFAGVVPFLEGRIVVDEGEEELEDLGV